MKLAPILVLFLAIGFHHTTAEPLFFDIIGQGIRAAGQAAQDAADIGGSIASGIANTASQAAKGAIGAATGIAQGVAKTAGSVASGAANAAQGAIGTASGIAQNVVGAAGVISPDIASAAQGAIGTASKVAQGVAGAAGSVASGAASAAAGAAGIGGSIASGFVSGANNVTQGVISVGTVVSKGVINAKTTILTNPRTVIKQIAGLANNVSSKALQTVLRRVANTLRDTQTNSRSALQQSEIAARQIREGIIELGQKQQASIQDWGNNALNKLSNSSEDTQFKGQDLIQDVVNKHAEDLQKCTDNIVSSLEQLQEKANATSERYHEPMTKLIEQVDKCAQLKTNDFRGLSKCAVDTGKKLAPLSSAPGAFASLKADFVKVGVQNLEKNGCVAIALSKFRKDSQNTDKQIDQLVADDKKASTEESAPAESESDASDSEGSGADASDAEAADSTSSDASANEEAAADSSSSDASASDAAAADSSSSDAAANDEAASDAPASDSDASQGQESDDQSSEAATS